jgi:histidinol-phosphate aminotransferase
MGLLDYYRQFEALSQEEVNRELRERARERKTRELQRTETLDLSRTTWPELPHPEVAAAITFAAQRGLQHYPNARAAELRAELAHRHDIAPNRIAIGNGAAQLLRAAAALLMRPGDELVTLWPSYPLLPALASRVHGSAVPVRSAAKRGREKVDALLAAVGARTRVLALASPNDPTGEVLATEELRALCDALPEHVAVLLDEALVELSCAQPPESSLSVLAAHPRLIVFRSFSKAFGLAGVRVGYALGGEGAEAVLRDLEPDLGVSELAQVAALQALRSCSGLVQRRAHAIAGERGRVLQGLRERGFEVAESDANFVWARHELIAGDELTDRLAGVGVLVAPGGAMGEPGYVRIAVHARPATQRLLDALDRVL